MKKFILFGSASTALLATVMAVGATLLARSPESATRHLSASFFIGLLSVALFFVGLAFPRE